MICAAVSGGSATRIWNDTTQNIQTRSGMRARVMPFARRQSAVARMLIAVTVLPVLLMMMLRIQKSVLEPGENAFSVSGA